MIIDKPNLFIDETTRLVGKNWKSRCFQSFCAMAKIEKNRVLIHILLWSVAWFMLILFFTEGWNDPLRLLYRGLPVIVSLLALIAINLLYLLPELYFKKKFGQYFLTSFFLFIGIIWLLNNDLLIFSELAEKYNIPESLSQRRINAQAVTWLRFFIPLSISFVGSTLIELTHFANKKEKAAISIEKEKLDTEIKFLKSQINPHFLFNSLNNIYSMLPKGEGGAKDYLMKLSDSLRYMIYETDDDKVLLTDEIDYIKNYISLEKLRLENDSVNFSLSGNSDGLLIAPLLLIPLIENCFKHLDKENPFVTIDIHIEETLLKLTTRNSMDTINNEGGVGLSNLKERLHLLYPEKHQLNTKVEGKDHVGYLQLYLSP